MNAAAQTKITHREAAKILGVGEWYLRERRNGAWTNYPRLTRVQHRAGVGGRRGSTIWMFKEEIEALLNQLATPKAFTQSARIPLDQEFVEMALAMGRGGEKTLKALGYGG